MYIKKIYIYIHAYILSIYQYTQMYIEKFKIHKELFKQYFFHVGLNNQLIEKLFEMLRCQARSIASDISQALTWRSALLFAYVSKLCSEKAMFAFPFTLNGI